VTNRFRQLTLFCLLLPSLLTAAGKFTVDDYKRALWMTTRFYGAQRSGTGPNWLIMQHDTIQYRTSFTKDADGSRDLAGGWFDCGDHVTFGQTFFFSSYLLAKAYDMFPLGFHDLYNGVDYSDYVASGNWDMAGGSPDGIPDLLQELKYATDWIIKATPDGSTFYYQKGEGGKDHQLWMTAGKMSAQPVEMGGEPRKVYKNPNDGVMAALAAGALAIMSRVYKKYDEIYAKECLDHAKNAYSYAKGKKGQAAGAGDGGFYGGHSQPAVVAFITGASEMYAATGDNSYKTDAAAEQDKIVFHNWGFDYSNTHDLAPLAIATSGIDAKKLDVLKTMFVDQYTNSLNSEGVCTKGNSGWGMLRYPANHAFIAALWSQAKKDTSINSFIYKQVDYIMGGNNANQSFIVGFCSACSKQPKFPHHRNVYLCDTNPDNAAKARMTIPTRNEQFGYLVGGSWTSSGYKDDINAYAVTEGGIDYNAGLVGALGYIVSKLDPADTASMVGTVHPRNERHGAPAAQFKVYRNGSEWLLRTSDNTHGNMRIVTAQLYDHHGRLVNELPANMPTVRLNRSALPCGIYTIHLRLEGGRPFAQTFCTIR
jgi:endoglucanase